MTKTKIALVVADNDQKSTCLRYLQSFDLDITSASPIDGLDKTLSQESDNGIIIDLKTKLSTPGSKRGIV